MFNLWFRFCNTVLLRMFLLSLFLLFNFYVSCYCLIGALVTYWCDRVVDVVIVIAAGCCCTYKSFCCICCEFFAAVIVIKTVVQQNENLQPRPHLKYQKAFQIRTFILANLRQITVYLMTKSSIDQRSQLNNKKYR